MFGPTKEDQEGVKQSDVADFLDCSRSRVSAVLTGRDALPFHEAIALCRFFDNWKPIEVAMRHNGFKLVPVESPATALQVENGILDAVEASGKSSAELAALLRGGVAPGERPQVRAAALSQIAALEALVAICPEAP
jgi:plasmid maintenance system antidote protein VapI